MRRVFGWMGLLSLQWASSVGLAAEVKLGGVFHVGVEVGGMEWSGQLRGEVAWGVAPRFQRSWASNKVL